MCKPGDPVDLRPEPKNRYDEHAIAVLSERGVQLGYIASERAPFLGKMMREGADVVAVFQHESDFGAWVRIGFDGRRPMLPPPPAPRDEPPDYWPDEIPPDE